MSSNYDLNNFNSTFFLSLATMTFGFFAGALSYCLRSKCSSLKLCGCIEIIRDVELEADIEAVTPQPPETTSNQPTPPTEHRHQVIRRSFSNIREGSNERKEKEIDFHKSMI